MVKNGNCCVVPETHSCLYNVGNENCTTCHHIQICSRVNWDGSKIALGTVQFGLNYGINNKKGQVPQEEVFEILNESIRCGIDVLDTAYVYGNSEKVIGNYLKKYGNNFNIISKLPECKVEDVNRILDSSLESLGVNELYGYMCHSFQHYVQNPAIWDMLCELKAEDKIKKIGLSLYYPSELEYLIENNVPLDIIQVPYNVFDRRFEQYFPLLKKMGVEIYVRSVFLQGLVFKEPSELNDYFMKMNDKISYLHSLSAELGAPISALCVNFVTLNQFVDKVVVGIDSMQNLKEIISSATYLDVVKESLEKLYSLCEEDENMILPINWQVSR